MVDGDDGVGAVVVPFDAATHLDAAVEALLRVRAADPTYPPQRDAPATRDAFSAWLLTGDALARWVVLSGPRVRGFVQLTRPHRYMTDFLRSVRYASAAEGFAEIGKLFVDPEAQGSGAGTALLRTASRYAWQSGRQPVLAVVATSTAARELYRRRGWRELGSFDGMHGDNRVLVEERAAHDEGDA